MPVLFVDKSNLFFRKPLDGSGENEYNTSSAKKYPQLYYAQSTTGGR